MRRLVLAVLLLAFAPGAKAEHHPSAVVQAGQTGLSDATVLIVRHAEKPEEGRGLTAAGEARARAYADYFRRFEVDGKPVRIDALVATADSKKSDRPRLTLEPLGRALGMAVQQPFEDDAFGELAAWLRAGPAHRTILIAWHHGKLPDLVGALGGDPNAVFSGEIWPGGKWPNEVYDRVVVMRFGPDGRPVSTRVVDEPRF